MTLAWTHPAYPEEPSDGVHNFAESSARHRKGDFESGTSGMRANPLFSVGGRDRSLIRRSGSMTTSSSQLDATAWLAAIVESSDDAIVSKDLRGVVTSWNRGAEQMFGYRPEEMIGQSILKLIPIDRHSEEDFILGRVRRGERVRDFETQRQCKDGSLLHVSLSVSPIRNQNDEIIGVSKIARNITEHILAQETQALLLAELSHRSKNLLAVIDAIVRQTAKNTPSPEMVERISRRLQAMSINQDLMIERDWRGVEIAQIVRRQLAAFVDEYEARVTVSGTSCVVGPRVAQALGMAIFELAANALRFGALSAPAGTINVEWALTGEAGTRVFRIVWREQGGPLVRSPRKRGFGSTIIENMVARSVLGEATLTYAPTGVIWELVAAESGLSERPTIER